MSHLKTAAALALWMTVMATYAVAHDPIVSAKAEQADIQNAVPLYDNLGDLSYPITTQNPMVQRYFDQGLRLTYAFNHAEALRAYREAQRLDPHCAACYWGEAFVLGPNINASMDDDASNPTVAAIQKARALAQYASEREQALIGALAKRYSDDPKADRGALNRAYADAMAAVRQRFPDDQDIGVLYIDAVMNVSPWDYWEADGQTPKGNIGDAIQVAEQILATNPNHPGAIHLYIHLTEASTTPERAEPYANRLAALMPGAGHLVHMPSHTYYRVGRYEDSAQTNKVAVQADETYLARASADNIYRFGYYPHNIHFVLVSAQMAGDGPTVMAYAKRLEGKIPDAMAEQVGWVQAIRTAPYFAHAQFSSPETTLALPDPGDKFPLIQAMWHYARGTAFAAQNEVEKAKSEAAHIAELNRRTDFSALLAWTVPAPDLLNLARHVIEGRIAQAQGNPVQAIKEFEIAVAIQDSLAYTEPPYWYYPVRQTLGAALMQAGRAKEAESVFEQTLKKVPKNGWALYGLMEAQKAQGKQVQAQATQKRLQQAWSGDLAQLDLGRL
jgi:tetratricopeptide (TPR) repeat protein